MKRIFFVKKAGERPTVGSLPDRTANTSFVASPSSLHSPKASIPMQPDKVLKDTPHFTEKLARLKQIIKTDQAAASNWLLTDPTYPLLSQVQNRLKENLNLLKDITGETSCL